MKEKLKFLNNSKLRILTNLKYQIILKIEVHLKKHSKTNLLILDFTMMLKEDKVLIIKIVAFRKIPKNLKNLVYRPNSQKNVS